MLRSLFVYQARADDKLLEKIAGLTGRTHGYDTDNLEETPQPADLRAALAAVDG